MALQHVQCPVSSAFSPWIARWIMGHGQCYRSLIFQAAKKNRAGPRRSWEPVNMHCKLHEITGSALCPSWPAFFRNIIFSKDCRRYIKYGEIFPKLSLPVNNRAFNWVQSTRQGRRVLLYPLPGLVKWMPVPSPSCKIKPLQPSKDNI